MGSHPSKHYSAACHASTFSYLTWSIITHAILPCEHTETTRSVLAKRTNIITQQQVVSRPAITTSPYSATSRCIGDWVIMWLVRIAVRCYHTFDGEYRAVVDGARGWRQEGSRNDEEFCEKNIVRSKIFSKSPWWTKDGGGRKEAQNDRTRGFKRYIIPWNPSEEEVLMAIWLSSFPTHSSVPRFELSGRKQTTNQSHSYTQSCQSFQTCKHHILTTLLNICLFFRLQSSYHILTLLRQQQALCPAFSNPL